MADPEELVAQMSYTPTSKRFPTTDQAKACYMYYNSWHRCKDDFTDDEPQCKKLEDWAKSMCPMEWVRMMHGLVHQLSDAGFFFSFPS